MKPLPMMLFILACSVCVAWTQSYPPPAAQPTASAPAATAIIVPVASAPSAPASVTLPGPCAATFGQSLTGDPIILILSSEEHYVLESIDHRAMNWSDVPANYITLFHERNPYTNWRPNRVVTHHGNPYAPYFQTSPFLNVAGTVERFGLAARQPDSTRATLDAVAQRYRGLTTAQAQLLGYQQVGPVPGLGVVYLNRSLVDNRFDALYPEAFTFDRQGRLTSVQYILQSDQPLTAFGYPMRSSEVVPGAQQASVWLFVHNPAGQFASTYGATAGY